MSLSAVPSTSLIYSGPVSKRNNVLNSRFSSPPCELSSIKPNIKSDITKALLQDCSFGIVISERFPFNGFNNRSSNLTCNAFRHLSSNSGSLFTQKICNRKLHRIRSSKNGPVSESDELENEGNNGDGSSSSYSANGSTSKSPVSFALEPPPENSEVEKINPSLEIESQEIQLQADSMDEISEDVMQEIRSRLHRLEVLVLLRRLYRDVNYSERVLSMPIPKLSRSEELIAESSVRPRRRAKDFLNETINQRKNESEDITVNSPLEIMDYAEDIHELAIALKRDFLSFDGHLPIVFENQLDAETVRNTVDRICKNLEELSTRVRSSLTNEEVELAMQEKSIRDGLETESNVKETVRKGLQSTSDVLNRVKQRLSAVDLSLVDINIIQRTLQDVWLRLNGKNFNPFGDGLADFPRPTSVLPDEEETKLALILEVEALDKKLGEASRNRESRLRRKDVLTRTRLASEIKAMDAEVNNLRKELAVRTLQLEMQVIYMSLESELLLISGYQDVRTDEEESLLVVEFGLLDADLARLRTALDRGETILIQDEELEMLATDIPDLKNRLAIVEEAIIPLQQRASLAVQEGVAKAQEGSKFYLRGLRLLGGDLSYSTRLFFAAVLGNTLKPREALTLRRTVKDLLTMIPFTIILIAPITPVGHVMAFSFLQRYFPGFFPSSFNTKRQEAMIRYELIKQQMSMAASEREKEEARVRTELAEEETFQAKEEDEKASSSFIHGDLSSSPPRAPRSLKDRNLPSSLLLLQNRLPEPDRILESGESNSAYLSGAQTQGKKTEDTFEVASSQTSLSS